MKILLDHCVPQSLRHHFAPHSDHTAETAAYNGWEQLQNGKLLDAAQARGFDALFTVDQNLPYQQNLTGRTIRVLVVVAENSLVATLAPLVPQAIAALETMHSGEYRSLNALPDDRRADEPE